MIDQYFDKIEKNNEEIDRLLTRVQAGIYGIINCIPFTNMKKLHIVRGENLLVPDEYYHLIFADYPCIEIDSYEEVYIRLPIGADRGYIEYRITADNLPGKWANITMGNKQLDNLFIISDPVAGE